MNSTIFWFRRDLRLRDQPLLMQIAQEKRELLALYILEPKMGRAQSQYVQRSLKRLEKALREQGIHLWIMEGEPQKVLEECLEETGASLLAFNRVFEPDAIEDEKKVAKLCAKRRVELRTGAPNLLFEPGERCYKIFTPYWRAMRPLIQEPKLHLIPHLKALKCKKKQIDFEKEPSWASDMLSEQPVGEEAALAVLGHFCKTALFGYDHKRDFPEENATSRLSVYLHLGEISIGRVIQKVVEADALEHDQERFFAQLGWREFSHQLLFHFPHMDKKPLKESFEKMKWPGKKSLFEKWKQGETGYPIVDAGMRELWATGYMHNRVRMIAASFLVKHLLIDWREGERWFWETLIDADLSNNSAGWQWIAGCGTDASPYFRIFNPTLQAEKFDPNGAYVRKWIPELGTDKYPDPIVDHQQARILALKNYHDIKG